jgi:hypothetical protein
MEKLTSSKRTLLYNNRLAIALIIQQIINAHEKLFDIEKGKSAYHENLSKFIISTVETLKEAPLIGESHHKVRDLLELA